MKTPVQSLRDVLFAITLLVAAARADAAIYAIGTEPGCTHTTIQAALDAATSNPGEDFIRIPHSQVWTQQALRIEAKVVDTQVVHLEGFWADCNNLDDSQQTIIDGAGGAEAPVLRIDNYFGGTVSIDYLSFRNGDVSGNSGKGGGIYYVGGGNLVISNSSIVNNTAGLGGGLYVEPLGGYSPTVQILGNVVITGNTARDSGGGVFAEAAYLYMVEPNSIIAFNEATGYDLLGITVGGYGGGLVVNDTEDLSGHVFVGSAGVGNTGAIYGNTARYGGGVAVFSEEDSTDGAVLYFHATQAGIPAKIEQNFASVGGGGLYVRNAYGGSAYLWNASVEGNAAPEGSALFVEGGGSFNSNFGDPPAGAVPCEGESACVRIVGNIDQDALGQPTGGAVIHVDGFIEFCCGFSYDGATEGPRGTLLEGNRGGRLFDLQGGVLDASHVLMVNNELGDELVQGNNWLWFFLSDSTIAGNTIGGDTVLDFGDADDDFLFGLRHVLLWQPGKTSFAGDTDTTLYAEPSIVSEAGSLGGGPGAVEVASPRFIDPARSDYRLRAASPAIDYAPAIAGDDRDVAGLPRDQRIAAVPRPDGMARDIGAFERQSLLPLVLNGDFAGDTNQWLLPAGHAGNYQVENAPGSPDGSGSAQIAGTSGDDHLYGYIQCIHLPGPGTYALNGSARSESAQLSNPTALIWELRLDGGEGCIDGAITISGTHAIGTQSTGDQWVRPTNPAQISVSALEWNHNTSLTVIMALYPYQGGNTYNGLFDQITLEWSANGSDVTFADGFDGP